MVSTERKIDKLLNEYKRKLTQNEIDNLYNATKVFENMFKDYITKEDEQ